MSEEDLTVYGIPQKPQKIYRTCTFAGLGSKKDELLDGVIHAFEADGFKRIPPVEPFKLSLGAKDAVKFWDWSWRDKVAYYQMVGNDVLLKSNKRGAIAIIGLKAEARNNNLRFGYSYFKKIEPKSVAGIKSILLFVSYPILGLALGLSMVPFLSNLVASGWSLWALGIMLFGIFVLPVLPFIIYFTYFKLKRMFTEFNQCIVKIAESIGGKQTTPFKLTTFKLEE